MSSFPVRVLIVDDHEPFRRSVGSFLGQMPGLQIIGEVSDGLEAVRIAAELQPDLILLDIGLPTLNGIEAARRIREHSAQSKILFLSGYHYPEIVEEALRAGGCGYVLKADAGSELLAGVESVLQSKRFLSSSLSNLQVTQQGDGKTGNDALRNKIATLPPHNGKIAGCHAVEFYADDRQLVDGTSQFIGAALKAGSAAIVVATESHLASLGRRLQSEGVDLAAEIEQGRYIALDAAEMVSTVMLNGVLDSVRFLEGFETLILKAAKAASEEHRRVAIFGEATDLLCKQGNAEAAIQLETLGNQLCERFDVDILCGYSLGIVQGVENEGVLQQICAEHSAVYCP